jgi:hypothetical protein
VLAILDQITRSLSLLAPGERRNDGFRVLRQALGYGWSVAAAAAPQNAKPYLEKWIRAHDKDVAWVMKTNLSKSRMAELRKNLVGPAPKRRPAAKTKPAAKRSKPAPKRRPGSRAK